MGRLGFEVLASVVLEYNTCSPLKVNLRFGGAYRLHLRGIISRARYRREIRWHLGRRCPMFVSSGFVTVVNYRQVKRAVSMAYKNKLRGP
jgi:hypothetical protein